MNAREDMRSRGYRTVAEVAHATGFSEDTVRRWVRNKDVEALKLGRGGRNTPAVYILAESVVSHLGEHTRERINAPQISIGDRGVRLYATEAECRAYIDGLREVVNRVDAVIQKDRQDWLVKATW